MVYRIKSKDTLSEIARQHDVSVAALATRNDITPSDTIYAGKSLTIPAATESGAKQPPPAVLPVAVQRSIAAARVKAGRWRHIVIHHAGVAEGTVRSLDRYHREERHMEHGLAYHFLIGNGHGLGDGVIGVGNRWKQQLDGGHLRSAVQNQTALGICLIGNFDQAKPTAKQLRSLEALTRALLRRCKLSSAAVTTHQQINVVHTRCPGKNFPTQAFLDRFKPTAK